MRSELIAERLPAALPTRRRTLNEAAAAYASLHGLKSGRRTRVHDRRETEIAWPLLRGEIVVGSLILRVSGDRNRWYGELKVRVARDGARRTLVDKELVWPRAGYGTPRDETERRLKYAFQAEVDHRMRLAAGEKSVRGQGQVN
jgi:hypothetical protein